MKTMKHRSNNIFIMEDPRTTLHAHGYSPNKLMGQNFLVSELVLKEIISAASLRKDDVVLEAGPGLGVLTRELAKKVRAVFSVEKDKMLFNLLHKRLTKEHMRNVALSCENILDFSPEILRSRGARYKIVANIPYYLTARFLRKFLAEESFKPSSMVLLVQREVAERITARPPNMSLLSLSVQAYGEPEIAAWVPRDSFWPAPKVDSAILKISKISEEFFQKQKLDEKNFFELIRSGFSQKRKTLSNSLSMFFSDKKAAGEALKKSGLATRARPEELSLIDWAILSRTKH